MDLGYLIRRVTGIVRPTEVMHDNLSWQQKRTLKRARKQIFIHDKRGD